MQNAPAGLLPQALDKTRRYTPLFLMALLVGSCVGTVGGVFHLAVDGLFAERGRIAGLAQENLGLGLPVSMALSAAMVCLALFLTRRLAPETAGSGVQEIEGALAGVRTIRWRRILPVKFFGGLLSLGSGLALGREGPTIQMGAALAKMLAETARISDRHALHSLVAAGAGAGLAAAFNAPLAAILFVVEEMRRQFRFNFTSFHSVIIASAASDVMVRIISGPTPDIPMRLFPMPPLESLLLFFLFGALVGVVGFVFNHLLVATLNAAAQLEIRHCLLVGLILGAGVGVILWVFPPGAGGGRQALLTSLAGGFGVGGLLGLFLLRLAVSFFSYASGAPGGIFAPMLALGTIFGLFCGSLGQAVFPDLIVSPEMFAVAGMGALFAATVRAPVTGLVLVMEMTMNYSLTLPLIVTCISAAVTAEVLGGRPIYTVLLERTLAREGALPPDPPDSRLGADDPRWSPDGPGRPDA